MMGMVRKELFTDLRKKVINSGVKWSKVEIFCLYLPSKKKLRGDNESDR
jgi:hypothetical protein